MENCPHEISLSYFAPAWARSLAEMLNHIHATQHANQEKVMSEIEDLKAATTRLGTEVSEAVAKFKEVADKLEAALADDAESGALKAAATEAATMINDGANKLDTAFGTFTASGN